MFVDPSEVIYKRPDGKVFHHRTEDGRHFTGRTSKSGRPFHSVSEKNLQRYCTEFDFRRSTRVSQGYSDSDRADTASKQISGKRLMYKKTGWQQEANV